MTKEEIKEISEEKILWDTREARAEETHTEEQIKKQLTMLKAYEDKD